MQTEPDAPSPSSPPQACAGRWGWTCLAIILLCATGVRLRFIDRPFHRDPEGCSAFYGQLARNYIRRPITQTCGVPVMNMGRHNPPHFYGHHPPIVPASIAAVYWLFGFRDSSTALPPDWQTRLPTVLATLACLVAIFVLLRNRGSALAGLVAAAIFAFAPITAVYGGFADVISPQLLLFILLTIAAYERFWATPSWRTLALTSLAFVPAIFTDWPALFLPVALGLHFVMTRPPRRWPWMALFGAICGLLFALAYAQIWLVERDWTWMFDMVHKRSVSGLTDDKRAFTFGEWLNVAWQRAVHLHTLPVLVMAMLWMLLLLTPAARRARSTRLVVLLLGWAALHILIGRQGVFQHEWWWWPLTPAVAMAAGLLADTVHARLARSALPKLACVFAGVLVAAAICLGISTTRAARAELSRHLWIIPGDPTSHSIVDIGRAIRESAPPDTAVILVENDLTLGLWYYADRPIMQNVWTIPDLLDRRHNPKEAGLPFGWTEQWTAPPQRVIVPKIYQRNVPELVAYLRDNFVAIEPSPETAAKFMVFDLTQPRRAIVRAATSNQP